MMTRFGGKGDVSLKKTRRIKRHNHVVDFLSYLFKEFDDRLTLDNLRLSERDMKGELHILVNFRFRQYGDYAADFWIKKGSARRL